MQAKLQRHQGLNEPAVVSDEHVQQRVMNILCGNEHACGEQVSVSLIGHHMNGEHTTLV